VVSLDRQRGSEDDHLSDREEPGMTDGTCKHEGCTCEAGENGYCSEYCASHAEHDAADETAPHECGCGHMHCEHAAPAAAAD
jgi:hypothetical protein